MRTFEVYPKATLVGDQWLLRVKVIEDGTQTDFDHVLTAGVTAGENLLELKVVFTVEADDTDTPQDVDDALWSDDIRPGGGYQTVWGNWQEEAEDIIGGLSPGYTVEDYWAAWSQQQTAAIRTDARRALETQRGWVVTRIHWHEGDGTSVDWVR